MSSAEVRGAKFLLLPAVHLSSVEYPVEFLEALLWRKAVIRLIDRVIAYTMATSLVYPPNRQIC